MTKLKNIYDHPKVEEIWNHVCKHWDPILLGSLVGSTPNGIKVKLGNIQDTLSKINITDKYKFSIEEWTIFFEKIRKDGI